MHIELNRTVVIKTPNEHVSYNPEYQKYIERFIAEGRTLARLSQDPHPHIVGVIDLFNEGATHCLVMDFVPGENLFDAVKRRGLLSEAEILPCIRQIGEALVVVHEAGLVHRDVHPRNIMLRSNSKAVLIDFGIAKQVVPSTDTSINKDGHKAFAPYEQKARGSRELTVDIYSLAATLYYAVTGQFPPYSLDRKLNNISLTQPKQINPRISDQLNQAILNGMALEAKDRPQSMQAWLAMLEEPKLTSSPSVDRVHRKEVVRPKTNLNSEANLLEPPTRFPRIIPWGWLVGVLSFYLLVGSILPTYNASYIVWIVGVTVTLAGAVAFVRVPVPWIDTGETESLAECVTIVVFGAIILQSCWVATGHAPMDGDTPMAVTFASLGFFASAWAGDRLLKSFSKVHTFLILASTSSLGLGLGWLVYRIIFNKGS